MRNIIICMALFAGVIFAQQGSMKNRLGQRNAKNLVQQSDDDWSCDNVTVGSPILGDLPECPCNFTQLPGLGAGQSEAFQQRAEATQVTQLASQPDVQFNQICQTNCCECAEAAHAALAVQAKNRTFTISGAISDLERVYFAERERAAENSQSRSEKDTVCVTTNENGGLGAQPECIELTVCPPGLGNSTSN